MMTPEQYFWNRRQQVLRAYSQMQRAVGAATEKFSEKQLLPNLKEVWFDDFDEQFDIIPDDKLASSSRRSYGACSSVRRGNFHGRNFDFTFDPRTTHVVHVKSNPSKDRHAFAGVAKASFNDDAPDMMKIPNLLKDGINDHHVVININVVSKVDIDEVGLRNTETNPGKRRVHCDCVPSYVLAYANSAVDAIKLMKDDISIYGYLKDKSGRPEANEYLHYMVSDLDDTFVIEIIGNQLFVIGYEMNKNNADIMKFADHFKVDPVEFPYPIMTNWYLNYDALPDAAIDTDGKYTKHGCGIERFKVLSDNYDSAESMFELMKLARYKNELLKPITYQYFPFSDATGMSRFNYEVYQQSEELRKFIADDRAKMEHAFNTNDRTLGVWLTSHNAVYDIANKSFTFVFEEDYDHIMTFCL